MPWPTTFSVSQQPVACMELDTSPSQTTLPTQQLWPLCRRMQQWLQHMADTQATRCRRPSPPQPSSCPSTMSTRHIDSEGQTTWNNDKVTLPVTERPPQHRNSVQSVPSYRNVTWTCEHPKAQKECCLKQIFRKKTQTWKQWPPDISYLSHLLASVSHGPKATTVYDGLNYAASLFFTENYKHT